MNVMCLLGIADCDTDATVIISHRSNAWLQCRLSEEPGQICDSRVKHNIYFIMQYCVLPHQPINLTRLIDLSIILIFDFWTKKLMFKKNKFSISLEW